MGNRRNVANVVNVAVVVEVTGSVVDSYHSFEGVSAVHRKMYVLVAVDNVVVVVVVAAVTAVGGVAVAAVVVEATGSVVDNCYSFVWYAYSCDALVT